MDSFNAVEDLLSKIARLNASYDEDLLTDLVSSLDYACVDYSEDIMSKIRSNDPTITSLRVRFTEEIDDALGELGRHIGENTQLKQLVIRGYRDEDEPGHFRLLFRSFCEGVSRNRSIIRLQLCRCFIGADWSELEPLFADGHLTELDLEECLVIHPSCIASMLLGNASLKRVNIHQHQWEVRIVRTDEANRLIIEALAANPNLASLSVMGSYVGKKSCEAIETLLSSNNNMRTLTIKDSLSDGRGIGALSNGLTASALETLVLSDASSLTNRSYCVLMTGVSNMLKSSNSQLKRLDLSNNEMNDDGISMLSGGLSGNSTLQTLNLANCLFSTVRTWQSLASALSTSTVEHLIIISSGLTDEDIAALSHGLSSNFTLKTLTMSLNPDITSIGWQALSEVMPNSALKELNASCCGLDDESLLSLANGLAANTNLKTLTLGNNGRATGRGWSRFFRSSILQNPNTAMETLVVSSNQFEDEAMLALTNDLATNSKLRRLDLSDNRSLTAAGLQLLSTVFQSNHTLLEVVDLGCNAVTNEVLRGLAISLVGNTTLEILDVTSENITPEGVREFCRVLCDPSSINSTFSSNHTLRSLFQYHSPVIVPEELTSLLELNEITNKAEVARQKVLQTHFSDSNSTMQVFAEMNLKVLPASISWMGTDECGHSLMYKLFRSMAFLVNTEENKKYR